jgi:hypothetical protein
MRLLLVSAIGMEMCLADCPPEPIPLEEAFDSATDVLRVRYTGENVTTPCYYEVLSPQGGGAQYEVTNTLPSFKIEQVFKGDMVVAEFVPLLYSTDTGPQLYQPGSSDPDGFLVFLYESGGCRKSDGESMDPPDVTGPIPYELSECNIYNSQWHDVANETKSFLLQPTTPNSTMTPSASNQTTSSSNETSTANSMRFRIAGFAVVVPLLLSSFW